MPLGKGKQWNKEDTLDWSKYTTEHLIRTNGRNVFRYRILQRVNALVSSRLDPIKHQQEETRRRDEYAYS